LEDWRAPFLDFLEWGILPTDVADARRLVWQTKSYIVLHGQLYRQSTSEVLLRCVAPEDGRKLLLDIHSSICGHHTAPRALMGKAFRHGFFWLTAPTDAQDLVRACKGCQYYAKQSHLPV